MKRLCIHPRIFRTARQLPPAGLLVWAVDAEWVEADGRPRSGVNMRQDCQGQHSHWRWGEPTAWRPLRPAELRRYQSQTMTQPPARP